jgi:hypothetical protein
MMDYKQHPTDIPVTIDSLNHQRFRKFRDRDSSAAQLQRSKMEIYPKYFREHIELTLT